MMETVKINTEFIKLDQFLKWAGVSDSGLAAKFMIKDGKVSVNGQIELQRGKKLRKNDVVETAGRIFTIE